MRRNDRSMAFNRLALAIVLIAATPCTSSPPVGRWQYGASAGVPVPSASIVRQGDEIVVTEFAADRAFTTTTSRYNAETFVLIAADRHASCCGSDWKATLTRNPDGSYRVDASGHATAVVRPKSGTVVVDADALVPSMYAAGIRTIDRIVLPGPQSDTTSIATLDLDAFAGKPVSATVPSGDRAIRMSSQSGTATVLWFDPCTLVLHAIDR